MRENDPKLALSLAILSGGLTAPVSADPQADLDAFAANIERRFDGRCVGFGCAIFQNGSYARGGETQQMNLGFNQSTQKDCQHEQDDHCRGDAMLISKSKVRNQTVVPLG